MDLPVRNIDDLRSEISRLKGLEQEQSVALAQRFKSPGAILSSIISIFHNPGPRSQLMPVSPNVPIALV